MKRSLHFLLDYVKFTAMNTHFLDPLGVIKRHGVTLHYGSFFLIISFGVFRVDLLDSRTERRIGHPDRNI